MIAVCVSGARGRMGRQLVELLLAAGDLRLAAALERPDHPDLGLELLPDVRLGSDSRAAIAAADVLLDFSLPAAVLEHLPVVEALGKPLVTGTTGFSPDQRVRIEKTAGKVPVVLASNMSRGVFLLDRLVALASASLPGHDVEIFEIHHRNKADSPSGTALSLASTVQESAAGGQPLYGRKGRREAGEIGLSAARGGDVVGEHQVMFLGPGEQIVITHRATSREHFCRGALDAVRFVVQQGPGLYGMDRVFSGGGVR